MPLTWTCIFVNPKLNVREVGRKVNLELAHDQVINGQTSWSTCHDPGLIRYPQSTSNLNLEEEREGFHERRQIACVICVIILGRGVRCEMCDRK